MESVAPKKFGNPRGRPPGVQDWRSRYYDTMAKLKEMGHDPIEALILMAQRESCAKIRLEANKQLAARIAPPIKAITINTELGDEAAIKELRDELREVLDVSLENFKKEY